MHDLAAVATALVAPVHTGTETLAFLLRWFHILMGITWVGLLYFFNLVNVPFMKQVDATMKPRVFQYLTMPTLHIFRWSALLTVFLGFWYWGQIYVAAAAQREGKGGGSTIALFLLLWIGTWAILYAIIRTTPNPWVLGIVTAVLVIAAGWLFVNYAPVGRDDNHVLSIGIGGGLGFIMLFNVWGVIWPNNKKVIRGTLAGTPPANAATLARQAFLASRTNLFLSVPMVFFMAASYHYVIFGQ
jgi:uncharacterized membrane protein